VGKSKRVRSRLLSTSARVSGGQQRCQILVRRTGSHGTTPPNEFDALVQELRLIKQFRPRFNRGPQARCPQLAFIKVTRGRHPNCWSSAAPAAMTVARTTGPFLGAMRVGEALRELNDALGSATARSTRRCGSATRSNSSLLPTDAGCIRHEIQKCLGPASAPARNASTPAHCPRARVLRRHQ